MKTATSAPQPIGPIYITMGSVTLVPCSNRTGESNVAVIDTEDLALVKQHKWHCHSEGYAHTNTGGKTLLLHRLVLGLPHGHHAQVDHRDRDKMNNVKSNLRTLTAQGNMENMSPTGGRGKSIYRGVSWFEKTGKWRVRVNIAGKRIHHGFYEDEREAALAAAKARLAVYAFNDSDAAFVRYMEQELS